MKTKMGTDCCGHGLGPNPGGQSGHMKVKTPPSGPKGMSTGNFVSQPKRSKRGKMSNN